MKAALAEIEAEITALAVHCRPPTMTPQQRASWMRDWCEDLAAFDVAPVRLAFREWRHSGQTKFPTPGQILPVLRRQAEPVRPTDRAGPWRPLSDDEYEALSLTEKIRHHQILASRALDKAGAMWRDGRPMTAAEMGATWASQRALAADHMAEAQRLRDIKAWSMEGKSGDKAA